jgi:hypothetical protein
MDELLGRGCHEQAVARRPLQGGDGVDGGGDGQPWTLQIGAVRRCMSPPPAAGIERTTVYFKSDPSLTFMSTALLSIVHIAYVTLPLHLSKKPSRKQKGSAPTLECQANRTGRLRTFCIASEAGACSRPLNSTAR